VLVVEYDADLQTDLITSDVCELWEGLDGDINSLLDESVDEQWRQGELSVGRNEHTS
jgi:hypothetical protein